MPKQAIYTRDPLLTNVSKAFRNKSYIASRIFKDLQVPDISGEWYVYDKGTSLSDVDDKLARGSKSASKEVDYNVSLEPYGPLNKHSLKIFVPQDDINRAPNPLRPRQDATEILTDLFELSREREAAAIIQNASIITQNDTLSGGDQWSDYSNSDPLADIETGVETIMKNGVVDPNTMLLDFRVWRKLRRHPDLVGLFTNVSGGLLTRSQFLELLGEYGITELVIARTIRNTAKEGQTASLDWLWGKHAWLFHIAPGDVNEKTITFGKNLYLEGGRGVDTRENWDPDGQYIRIQDDRQQKVMAAEAAYAIFNAIA